MEKPISLKSWVEAHRHELKPPVGNKIILASNDYIIMAVAGPNVRSDYHINHTEEIFFQIEGDISLKVIEGDKPKTIVINEGETFLLPAGIPHSPQRPANTVGVVIEKKRLPQEKDGFQWYCEQCGEKMYEEFVHISDIVIQLPMVFDNFFADPKNFTCQHCGWVAKRDQ